MGKILNGTLQKHYCDNEEVFVFLSLLEIPNRKDATSFKPITEEEWVREVKRIKKQVYLQCFQRERIPSANVQ